MKSKTTSGHDAAARHEAATRRHAVMPGAAELATASAPVHGDSWQPVQGPHLRAIRRQHARNKTGIAGISLSHAATGRTYIVANLGSTNRRFCVDTLGHEEALRRALQIRAEHENAIRAANELILRARRA